MPRNRNQYMYVRSIGPNCWGTCPSATQEVNVCLVKFPELRCEPVPHVLVDLVVRGESFAPQSLFQGTKNGVIAWREIWTVRMVTHCIDHVQRYAREGNEFLSRVLAGDESWYHHLESESNRQSLQWKHPGSPPPKKSKVIHSSAWKVMLTFFFYQDGPLLIDFLQRGITVSDQKIIVTPYGVKCSL